MTSKFYVQKRGPSGGAHVDYSAFTGRKGVPFFDETGMATILMGHRCYQAQASQGQFKLMDPIAEAPRADFNYQAPAHALITWTEDAPGAEIWLARHRVAAGDFGRGLVKVDNEIEFDVLTEDCNVELRGQAFTQHWVRPAETDVQRLVALQLYTLNGSSSTATYHRDTCDVTVNTGHLTPNTNTVNMPAKKYPPGTQPEEVVRDCADTAGKTYGVVIHHTGGSHLCLFYTIDSDHSTYASTIKISDHDDEVDPDHPTDPVFVPHWEAGLATQSDSQSLLSGMVGLYGTEQATYVTYAINEESYDYWVDVYNDTVSTTSGQAAARTAGILEGRRLSHISHRASIILAADQVDLVAAGMSLQIKAAAAMPGQYLNTYQTRRIGECTFEPRIDGTYWAHLSLDRPPLRVAPGKGHVGPIPPVQSEPGGGVISDYLWTFTDNNNDTTNTYPVGNEAASQWHPGYIHSHVIQPGVGNHSESTKPPISPGTYHFRIVMRRGSTTYNGGGITATVKSWDGGVDSLIWTSSAVTAIVDTTVEDDITFPAGADYFTFGVDYNDSYIAEAELTHGSATASFAGTSPPPASTDGTGAIGTSPIYAPADHQHPWQEAENTPISDTGGYFIGQNVEEALQELGAGSGGSSSIFNVLAYGATGDGTTDDTSGIDDAIDALVAEGRGVLYFPAGTYKTTAALTTLSVPCIVRGDGSNDYDGNSPISLVTSTSDTANLFTVTADFAKFENIAFRNDEGNPSAGSAVSTQGAHLEQRVDFESVVVHSFYIGLDVQVGGHWSIRDCFVYDPVLYGIKIRNTVNADAGDWSISDTEISSDSRAATAGIRIESSGGAKINNIKVNMGYPPDQKFTNGIDVAVTTGITTVILLVTNSSFENVTGHGISVTSTGTGEWRDMVFSNNQFGLWTNNTGKAISISPTSTGDVEDIVIANNVFFTDGTARSAVALTNTDNVTLVGNLLAGNFTSLYTNTGSTNVVETVGDATSHIADTTDAHDASAISIVDAGAYYTGTEVETALQELGTIGAGISGLVGPILISDTPSTPLVFADLIQNEAQDDLVYSDP